MSGSCLNGRRNDVGVVCTGTSVCTNGQVILQRPTNTTDAEIFQRVLVCFGNTWGYICPERWSAMDAEVICRQLRLPLFYLAGRSVDVGYEQSTDRLWMTDVRCMGIERNILQCPRRRLGIMRGECRDHGFAGVACRRTVPCVNNQFRLISPTDNSSTPSRGRLEVCYRQRWATVCGRGLVMNNAVTLCNNLNLQSNSPTLLSFPDIQIGTGNIVGLTITCNAALLRRTVPLLVHQYTVLLLRATDTSGGDSNCTISIEDGVESSCSHSDDIGLNCMGGSNPVIVGGDGLDIFLVASTVTGSSVLITIIVTVVVIVILIVVCVKMKKRSKMNRYLHNERGSAYEGSHFKKNSSTSLDFDDDDLTLPRYSQLNAITRTVSVSLEHLDTLTDDIIIRKEHLELLERIGQGEYGMVYRGHLLSPIELVKSKTVAVKTLKGPFDQADVDSLMEESVKMKKFDHPNVLGLIGVCLNAGPSPYIVLPYMANGSLLNWLKRERNRIVIEEPNNEEEVVEIKRELLSACHQIAKGMEYLAAHKFIHRDLAARNCMMDEYNMLKVSDFGLSQDIYEKNYFHQSEGEETKLLIRWMALESVTDGLFSEKTDVWSFGVTCWEVFSGGKMPYGGVSPMSLPQLLEEGERLQRPLNASCMYY